jgi:DNA-binding CsgD family transcriptional regulator
MYSTSLDAVSTPLFVLDQRGRVVFANAAAVEVIRGGELLRVVDGMLEPSPWMIERKACLAALQKLASGIGSTVCLTVGERRRQMLLSTAPLPKDGEVVAPWGAAAGLVWLAPFARKSSAVKRVAALFGLSPAEETLLARLASGATLAEAAVALCLSIHTVRTQLKAVQRKTGWRTQGELVRMVQQLGAIDPR